MDSALFKVLPSRLTLTSVMGPSLAPLLVFVELRSHASGSRASRLATNTTAMNATIIIIPMASVERTPMCQARNGGARSKAIAASIAKYTFLCAKFQVQPKGSKFLTMMRGSSLQQYTIPSFQLAGSVRIVSYFDIRLPANT